MAQQGILDKLAKEKGITVRALLMDALHGAADYETACAKLGGISRQGLDQALAKYALEAYWVKHLEVATKERSLS